MGNSTVGDSDMAGKAKPWTSERQLAVGSAVLVARLARMPWKALERQFRHERTQLWRCAQAAKSLMQQNIGSMQHLPTTAGVGARESLGPSADMPSWSAVEKRMGGFLGGSSPPPPPAAPAAPTFSDPAVTNAAREEQINAARARGRAATLLTGGQGQATGAAPTAQKFLLGS